MNQVQMKQEFNEIKKLLYSNFINEKPVLTSKEVVVYLNISYSMLSKLSAAGLIPSHQPTNGLKFYFKNEIHEWIRQNKVYSDDDAIEMIKKHRKKRGA